MENQIRSPVKGQTTVETVLVLPLFFVLAFGVFQVVQLGWGVVISTYAAGSIARKAAQDGKSEAAYLTPKYKNLLSGGMRNEQVSSNYIPTPPFAEITVHACAQINAWPLVGNFLSTVWKSDIATASSCTFADKVTGQSVYFSGSPPYYFIVHGQAKVRMNYTPQ